MIFEYLNPIDLFQIRLVSSIYKSAAVPIIRRKLFVNSMIRVYTFAWSSIRSYCKPTDVSPNPEICEWLGDASFVCHSWDRLQPKNKILEVVPSPAWAWYRPARRREIWHFNNGPEHSTYRMCVWGEKPHDKSSGTTEEGYEEINDEEGLKHISWMTQGGTSIPWTVTYTRISNDVENCVVSVKLPLWALVKIHLLYMEEFQMWKSWQPQHLTAESTHEAEYYLEYFRRTQHLTIESTREAKSCSDYFRRFQQEPYGNIPMGICENLRL